MEVATMKPHPADSPGLLARLRWWILSTPLFFKIMGIGAVVAALFGGVTLVQIRGSVSRGLHLMLEARAHSLARSLASSLERPMSTSDLLSIKRAVDRTVQTVADVRYVIVRDARGQVITHTFPGPLPSDLLSPVVASSPGEPGFRVLACAEGRIFEAAEPILDGHAGVVQLGVTDRTITKELAAVTSSVLRTLALCATIGAGLALLLTHLLTQPIHRLVETVNRIRRGQFEARSPVFSDDEIGRLAVAFNQMSESLERYRREVEEKERARVSLIERIVYAQEEERKTISRELHDQLGQSLLALLLEVDRLCQDGRAPQDACENLRAKIRSLIEEVRRLAWGMRPSILDDYGLDYALARHTEEIAERFGLPIDYQYSRLPGLGRLPGRVEVALYRIAQEAIMNVVRHARANRASAVVLQRRSEVTLLVEDDGRGFDPAAVRGNGAECLGLTGMQERAALLGGSCAVESAPGHGTTVRVRIPIAEQTPCPSES